MQRQTPSKDTRFPAVQQESETRGFDVAAAEYLRDQRIAGHTAASLLAVRSRVGEFARLMETEGLTNVGDIDTVHARVFLAALWDRGLAPATVRSRWGTIKAFLRWCYAEGWIEHDPTQRIRLPKTPQQGKEIITEAQFKRLLAQASLRKGLVRRRCTAILWILLRQGLRRSELARLAVPDVDLDQGLLRVMGKGQKERVIPLHQEPLEALNTYLRMIGRPARGPLWVTHDRRPLTANGLIVDIQRLQGWAGVQVKDAFHAFRRTCAWRMAEDGVPRQTIMWFLGWSTASMIDYYTRGRGQDEASLERLRSVSPWGR